MLVNMTHRHDSPINYLIQMQDAGGTNYRNYSDREIERVSTKAQGERDGEMDRIS